ncbi:hypothetical protein FEP07_02589 [Burkholderia multivorans]|nr:hypothetical protein [Burkholderia multivorans]MDR9268651.1 hypothetical protein [Burkholderia multivorans]MDR9285487.1 hypothetical protein [Burkholderia multivorans]MDR9291243.1 hypothetical protein [Burkholderia multivorans]MDR9313842.1 hypothetical protein [Burkholderia multivorans]
MLGLKPETHAVAGVAASVAVESLNQWWKRYWDVRPWKCLNVRRTPKRAR